jgi:hypothetical protein
LPPLKFFDEGAEGSVGVQSIISVSLSVVSSSSIRSFANDDGPGKVGESRDGRPKIGFGVVVTTGVEDRESVARRSGSEGRGAGDERTLVLGEGTNVGSDGNLWVGVSRSRMEGGCCNRRTTQEQKKIWYAESWISLKAPEWDKNARIVQEPVIQKNKHDFDVMLGYVIDVDSPGELESKTK